MRYFLSLILANVLFFQPAFATLNNVDKTQIFNKNLFANGGFENGKALWTPNDSADFTTTTTTPLEGSVNGVWDADAASDTLVTTAVAIPSGMYGRNAVASCLTSNASGTATHEIQAYDGSNVLAEATVTSSSTPSRTSANFIMPSSGNIQLRIFANADEPELEIDSCFIGPAEGYNVGSYAAAIFIGSAFYATTTNCTWTRANTALGAFGTDADCPAPTIDQNPGPGTIDTTDNNLPQLTINNLPPGRYRVSITGYLDDTAGNDCVAINDGTNTRGRVCSNADSGFNVEAVFEFTSSGNRTFALYSSSASGSVSLVNAANNQATWFHVYRYPLSSEQSYTADKLANAWSGYHDDDCSWARTSTTVADPTADAACTFAELTNNSFGTVTSAVSGSDKLPGIVFTPSRAGRYFVCASFSSSGGALGARVDHQIVDGSSNILDYNGYSTASSSRYAMKLCGFLNATSTASQTVKIQSGSDSSSATIANNAGLTNTRAVFWHIFQADQSFSAPNLVNSVVTPSNGVIQIVSAQIDSSDAVTNETGDWINGNCTNATTGRATCTINSGIFASTPNCMGSTNEDSVNATSVSIISVSTTSVVVETAGTAGAYNGGFNLFCMGSK